MLQNKLNIGNVVSTTKHSHLMTVSDINSEGKVVCQYFIDSKLHTEFYEIKDLTFISD